LLIALFIAAFDLGIGFASEVVSFYILGSCGFMCAMSGYYFANSFQSPPPWTTSSENNNIENCSNSTMEESVDAFYK